MIDAFIAGAKSGVSFYWIGVLFGVSVQVAFVAFVLGVPYSVAKAIRTVRRRTELALLSEVAKSVNKMNTEAENVDKDRKAKAESR